MEKIATKLLLPPLFFNVCLNSLLDANHDKMDPEILFLEYFEFLQDHLARSPFSRFLLEKYSEKSYVLYPTKKVTSHDESFLLHDLKGIENKRLKKGAGYVFPLFRLSQLQAFLLRMPQKKNITILSKQAEELQSVPITSLVESYLFELSHYMNLSSFTAQDCKKVLNESIPDFYDRSYLLSDLSHFQTVSQHMLHVARHFLFEKGKETLVVTKRTKHDVYALVFNRHDVTHSKEYAWYKEQYESNWMNSSILVSKDKHILYYSYTSFTGD